MVPRKGAYVAGLTLKEVADVFEIRGCLKVWQQHWQLSELPMMR